MGSKVNGGNGALLSLKMFSTESAFQKTSLSMTTPLQLVFHDCFVFIIRIFQFKLRFIRKKRSLTGFTSTVCSAPFARVVPESERTDVNNLVSEESIKM